MNNQQDKSTLKKMDKQVTESPRIETMGLDELRKAIRNLNLAYSDVESELKRIVGERISAIETMRKGF